MAFIRRNRLKVELFIAFNRKNRLKDELPMSFNRRNRLKDGGSNSGPKQALLLALISVSALLSLTIPFLLMQRIKVGSVPSSASPSYNTSAEIKDDSILVQSNFSFKQELSKPNDLSLSLKEKNRLSGIENDSVSVQLDVNLSPELPKQNKLSLSLEERNRLPKIENDSVIVQLDPSLKPELFKQNDPLLSSGKENQLSKIKDDSNLMQSDSSFKLELSKQNDPLLSFKERNQLPRFEDDSILIQLDSSLRSELSKQNDSSPSLEKRNKLSGIENDSILEQLDSSSKPELPKQNESPLSLEERNQLLRVQDDSILEQSDSSLKPELSEQNDPLLSFEERNRLPSFENDSILVQSDPSLKLEPPKQNDPLLSFEEKNELVRVKDDSILVQLDHSLKTELNDQNDMSLYSEERNRLSKIEEDSILIQSDHNLKPEKSKQDDTSLSLKEKNQLFKIGNDSTLIQLDPKLELRKQNNLSLSSGGENLTIKNDSISLRLNLSFEAKLPEQNLLSLSLEQRNGLPPRNTDLFPSLAKDHIKIVLYVHNRPKYLNIVVKSLSQVEGIGETMLIVSHDGYFPEMDHIIQGIRFCQVKQIFAPYSPHLFPDSFPGVSPGDCRDKDNPLEKNCQGNADHYGNHRSPRIVSLKHHWWWMMNTVWDGLPETHNFNGHILFIEEDHFILPNAYRNLQLLVKLKPQKCPECYTANLAPSDVKSRGEGWANLTAERMGNIGYTFNRTVWRKIHGKSWEFCNFDEYNWDSTIESAVFPTFGAPVYTLRGSRASAVHFGKCGLHQGHEDGASACIDDGEFKFQVEEADKVCNINPDWSVFLFPRQSGKLDFKGWGGWGDERDRRLCLSFAYMYHQNHSHQ